MKIYKNNELLLDNCKIASGFWDKLFGKIFVKEPLLLVKCNSVHTYFISKNLDIVFLDNENNVIQIFKNFPKNNLILPVKNAAYVLEFDAGFSKSDKINVADTLVFEE